MGVDFTTVTPPDGGEPGETECDHCGERFDLDHYGDIEEHDAKHRNAQHAHEFKDAGNGICTVCWLSAAEGLHVVVTEPRNRVSITFDEQDPMVHHPPHYRQGKYEVIDILTEFFPTDPLLWQVAKYIMRAGKKGDEVQDLEKARWYLDRKIDSLKEARRG